MRVDRQTPYRRGEPIRVSVRFPDDVPPPTPETKVEVLVTRSPSERGNVQASAETEKQTLQLARVDGSRATYEALITRTPEGEYRFWLASPLVPDPRPRARCSPRSMAGSLKASTSPTSKTQKRCSTN